MKFYLKLKENTLNIWNKIPNIFKNIFVFLIIATFIIFSVWKISDMISDYKYNKKIKEYEKITEILNERDAKLIEDNKKLSEDKKNLEVKKQQSDETVDKLLISLEKTKSQVVYINRDISKVKTDYEKDISNINNPIAINERINRLCKTRKELGYEGGICSK